MSVKTSDSSEDNTQAIPPQRRPLAPTASSPATPKSTSTAALGGLCLRTTSSSFGVLDSPELRAAVRRHRVQDLALAILAHMGHVLSENRHGLIIRVQVTQASGTAEREATLSMLEQYEKQTGHRPKTVGADKGYDSGEFLQTLESRQIEPHIAVRDVKRDHETRPPHQQAAHEARVRMQARRDETGLTRFRSSAQRCEGSGPGPRPGCRKKVEECFGWFKTIAGLDKLRHVGQWKIQQQLELAGAAFNLIRLRKLAPLT